ncbi:MAG: hypothetical protein L3J66_13680 [Bacteroidales bacterium]|nr:hypothetical protein [Bacteroidales bacterium]
MERLFDKPGFLYEAIVSHLNQDLYLVNCTFSDNSIVEDEPSLNMLDANLYLYNCISYNEGSMPLHISVWEPQKEIVSHLYIYNSLIEGGEESIFVDPLCNGDTWCRVHYDETNIDEDPLFLGKWEHPYQIADGSPCIDAAPNPFSTSTTLSAKWDFSGHVQIEIYTNAGLRVKVIKSGRSGGKGSIQTRWDGKDQNGNILPAGVYHVVMFWEGKEVEGMKVVKR